MKLQIKPHGVDVDKSNFAQAQAEFAECHCILLRNVVEPNLLLRLLPQVVAAPVYERVHSGHGARDENRFCGLVLRPRVIHSRHLSGAIFNS